MKQCIYLITLLAFISSCNTKTNQEDLQTEQTLETVNENSMEDSNPEPETINNKPSSKFEPEDGTVLVFVGQDNEAVGGNDALMLDPPGKKKWDNGYLENFIGEIGVPAGITHYVYMSEGKTNDQDAHQIRCRAGTLRRHGARRRRQHRAYREHRLLV